MKTGTYNIGLGFDQILDLVRQLPKKRETQAFKTDDLDQETIDRG